MPEVRENREDLVCSVWPLSWPPREGEGASVPQEVSPRENPKAQHPCRSNGVLAGGKMDGSLHWGHVGAAQSGLFGALHVCTSRVSSTRAVRQPASLACTVLPSGRGPSPGPWGSSRPPAHPSQAPRAWGPLAAPWVHSQAPDSASFLPTSTPPGRGQHWPQVRVRKNWGSGRGLFPMEILVIRSNKRCYCRS